MGIKRSLFNAVSRSLIGVLGLNKASKISSSFVERITPVFQVQHKGKTYFFECPSEFTLWRAETFLTKEPETLEWIDTFGPNDVLFDIGANIGLYSIYAAKKGNRVVAFEPESQNYALINKNFYLNGIAEKAMCLNIALSDGDALDYLYIPQFIAGGALNNFGEAKDWQHKEFVPSFKQGVLAFSLDSFLAQHPQCFPDHIKVDVDGIEAKIIRGAEKTLKDRRVKSVLIEINETLAEDRATAEFIQSCGFPTFERRHSTLMNNSVYKDVYNYIFRR